MLLPLAVAMTITGLPQRTQLWERLQSGWLRRSQRGYRREIVAGGCSMVASDYGYGLWPLMAITTAVFLIFAFSFTYPLTARDWRSIGEFSAFIGALFSQIYGFPLTSYLLSGWLGAAVCPNQEYYA